MIKRHLATSLFASAFTLATAFTATAVQAADSAAFDLGEIVVKGQKASVEKTKAENTVEVTAEQIRESGAQNVAEALENSAGLFLHSGGRKADSALLINGIDQGRVLIMIDGVPINAPYYRESDLAFMPVDNISKIVVVKSAASSAYGANALGGVINIVTAKPVEGTSGSLTMKAGQNKTVNPSLTYGYNTGRFYVQGTAQHLETDGYDISHRFTPVVTAAEDGGLRNQSDRTSDNYSFLIGLQNDKTEYALNINYIDAERGTPFDVTTNKGYINRFTEWKKYTIDLSSEQQVSDKLSFREKIYYHKFDNTLTRYTNLNFNTIATLSAANGGGSDISTFDDYTAGLRLLADYEFSADTILHASLNYNRENHQKEASPGYSRDESETDNYSVGLDFEAPLADKLSYSVGSSFDGFIQQSAVQANSNGIGTYDVTTQGSKTAMNYYGGLIYQYDEKTTLSVTAAHKTRFPTQSELYLGGCSDIACAVPSETVSKIGNALLDPEENDQFTIGYSTKFDSGLKFGFGYFHNDITDYINSVGTGIDNAAGDEIFQYQNAPGMISKGFELSLSGKYRTSFHWTLAYTNTKAEFTSTPGVQIDRTPHAKTNIVTKRVISPSLAFDLSTSFISASNDSQAKYAKTIKPFALVNAGFSGNVKSIKLDWALRCDNVMDKLYWEEVGYPQPGRTFRAEATYKF